MTFYKVAQAQFLSVKFDNVVGTFFVNHVDEKIITHSEPTMVMTLLHRPSIHLNKSLTILKMTFYKVAQAQFLSVKIDNVVSNFFVNHLDKKISTQPEPTTVMTLLHRPSIHLNKSLTILKMSFYEIAQAQF